MDRDEARRRLQDAIRDLESAWDDFGECVEEIAAEGIDLLALDCKSVLDINDILVGAMEALLPRKGD